VKVSCASIPNQINEDNFNTDAYLAGQYEGLVKTMLEDLNPNSGSSGTRKVRLEDGIFFRNTACLPKRNGNMQRWLISATLFSNV
jgi:hypothetical protein